MKQPVVSTTFGAGRDAYCNVVSVNKFNHTPFVANEPGPGAYSTRTKSNDKKKYSMRPKTACDCKLLHGLIFVFSSLNYSVA
jgi:hypothetical protein